MLACGLLRLFMGGGGALFWRHSSAGQRYESSAKQAVAKNVHPPERAFFSELFFYIYCMHPRLYNKNRSFRTFLVYSLSP